jgi:hypothetical protein
MRELKRSGKRRRKVPVVIPDGLDIAVKEALNTVRGQHAASDLVVMLRGHKALKPFRRHLSDEQIAEAFSVLVTTEVIDPYDYLLDEDTDNSDEHALSAQELIRERLLAAD